MNWMALLGFRKVDPDRWEFANEGFLRGQKHLLKNIIRRKPVHGGQSAQQSQQPHGQSSSVNACVEVGKFGLEEEVGRLKRDKNVLMQELVRLRQQQQATDTQLQAMVNRLHGMEQRQQQMMTFLAKAMQSPGFLAQFVQQNESNKRITEANKKRRFQQEVVSGNAPDGQIVKYQPSMNDSVKAMLAQLMQMDNFSHSDSLNNNPDNTLFDGDNSLSHQSGVTLQEVSPSSGQPYTPTTPEAISVPQADVIMPDLPLIPDVAPENTMDFPEENLMGPETGTGGGYFDAASLLDIDLEDMSPDPDIDALLEKSNFNWDDLIGPQLEDVEQSVADDEMVGNEEKATDDDWDKGEHMNRLTKQMGFLTPDNKNV
ncbi:hypothetical protein ACFE04_011865 [Oxalis oulophora]